MHITNSFQREWWPQIDEPMTRQLVERIVNREQEKLDGLVNMGALVGLPAVDFVESNNPRGEIMLVQKVKNTSINDIIVLPIDATCDTMGAICRARADCHQLLYPRNTIVGAHCHQIVVCNAGVIYGNHGACVNTAHLEEATPVWNTKHSILLSKLFTIFSLISLALVAVSAPWLVTCLISISRAAL
ncbi:MAG: hypothetical protein LBT44_04045, partial [Clostridiales bacterium]|nr:hypothetical protein [Clostridiales bacterium]